MVRYKAKLFIRSLVEESNEETRFHFYSLGKSGRFYSTPQKEYALSQLDVYGIRATSRILQIPRRTIQRWCRQYSNKVNRCPLWIYEWADRRRRKREFWERRGYY